jgi:hypothetical protein
MTHGGITLARNASAAAVAGRHPRPAPILMTWVGLADTDPPESAARYGVFEQFPAPPGARHHRAQRPLLTVALRHHAVGFTSSG